jgi:hypothetical protein
MSFKILNTPVESRSTQIGMDILAALTAMSPGQSFTLDLKYRELVNAKIKKVKSKNPSHKFACRSTKDVLTVGRIE